MKILSLEKEPAVFVTTVVETEEGNVVVKEIREVRKDGTLGVCLSTDMLWERSGQYLCSEDDAALYEEIEEFLCEQEGYQHRAEDGKWVR